MGILKSKVRSGSFPLIINYHIIIKYYNYIIHKKYNYYISNKGLLEESDKKTWK